MTHLRGIFQGWICGPNGDFAVYRKDGQTLGFLASNKDDMPDYAGTEHGLYRYAGTKPMSYR